MTKAIQLTSTDSASHNLYALILTEMNVTQLPQRVDLGAIFFPDFVQTVTFTLPLNQSGNSGESLSIQDQNGIEMTSVLPGIPYSISGKNNIISLQAIKIQASASGVVTDVAIVQS
jgi:hypothetical protein